MDINKDILTFFDFDDYAISIKEEDRRSSYSHFIKNEISGKIDIDRIYFSGNYASVYFKNITSFNNDSLKDICLIHKSIWNQRKVPFLFVSTPTELRIYNCFKEPIDPNKNLNKLEQIEIAKYSLNDNIENLNKLVAILGRSAIDSGSFWQDKNITNEFDVKNRVDNVLVENLKATKRKLKENGIPIPIIHDILTRSLFILYLEDIEATDAEFYSKFKKDCSSYYQLLTDKEATYRFFKHLEIKFNGNLFNINENEEEKITLGELELVASCFWGNEVGSGQLNLWKKFDFRVIPIELLSEVYEIFLNKTKEEKAQQGEYYTPHSLVDLILSESLPWADEVNSNYNLKILDVACGSGIFLVESYRRLVDRWIWVNKEKPQFEILRNILLNSIYGFEINKESIKVASFSLYLALISFLDPKSIWQKREIKFPYLIFDPENHNNKKQGFNLFQLSSLSNTIEHQPSFDLVVGNPPFKSAKTGSIEPEASAYCHEYDFAQEMVLPFLHRASQFCNETGKVAIISTSKILFNKSGGYKKFREFLFRKNYVEAVFNFSALRKAKKGKGKSIFSDAVGPACVLFYKKVYPEHPSTSITYLCPKPTKRDVFSNDLIIDALDFYFLPRIECEKNDTSIWKSAMWGTENDFRLIKELLSKKSLDYYLSKHNGWEKGVGFKFLTLTKDKTYESEEISRFPIIEAKYLQRYYTNKQLLIKNLSSLFTDENKQFYFNYYNVSSIESLPTINIFRGLGNKNTYTAPHLLVKEGQKEKRFTASFLNFDCCFKHTVLGISFNKEGFSQKELKENELILKALTGFLNSKLASYILFLTSVSWGIERERVTPLDLLQLPALPFEMSEENIRVISCKVDKISKELSKDFPNKEEIVCIENEIDEMIYKAIGLSQREQYLVEDVLDYSLDLFQEGEKSRAYLPVKGSQLNNYLQILSEDINEHFQFSGSTVWTSCWEMPVNIPMQLVAVHFTSEHPAGEMHTFSHTKEIDKIIRQIDKYSYEKYSESVFFRKIVKFYSGDIVYIIKPNERRFWSRSQAMQDSTSILLEIANMDNG